MGSINVFQCKERGCYVIELEHQRSLELAEETGKRRSYVGMSDLGESYYRNGRSQ